MKTEEIFHSCCYHADWKEYLQELRVIDEVTARNCDFVESKCEMSNRCAICGGRIPFGEFNFIIRADGRWFPSHHDCKQ